MTAATRPSRTQEERNAIARAKLCKAALELIALHGHDAISLAEIGLRAGYSRGLAQYYFNTKSGLVEALLDDMAKQEPQIQVLNLPANATGADAWRQLLLHLDASWSNFCSMHDGSDSNLAARGEMILCATAIFSPNTALRDKLNAVSRRLTSHVSHALRLCVRDGVLRSDLDPDKIALFYVTGIWGMVNALFANPHHKDFVSSMVDTMKSFLHSLRP